MLRLSSGARVAPATWAAAAAAAPHLGNVAAAWPGGAAPCRAFSACTAAPHFRRPCGGSCAGPVSWTPAPWPSRFQQGRHRPIPSHSESGRRGDHTAARPAIRAPSLPSSPVRRKPPDTPERRQISAEPCGPGPTDQARRAVRPGAASPTGPHGIAQDADAPDGVGSGPRPRRSDVDAKREGDARH